MDEIRKIPPVTRVLVGSSLAVTVGAILKFVNPYHVLFSPELVFSRKLQLWRLYSSFFLGSGGLQYIFELVMLYQTANDLESRSYAHRSSDLAWQLLWSSAAIVGITWPLRPVIFTRAFLVNLVYLYAALAPPGTTTSIMGLLTIPIAYYPYVLIGFDLLLAGPQAAALSVAGAIVGHGWWWGVWGGGLGSQGVLAQRARAPEWLRRLMGETGPRARVREAGGAAEGLARSGIHVTAPRVRAGEGRGGGETGHSWGQGRRLGNN